MSRPIRVQAPVRRPLMASERAFRKDPSSWLPQPNDHEQHHAWHMYLWAGRIGVLVDVWVGDCRREQETLRRQIQLEPDRSSFLGRHAPSFIGDLVVIREDGATALTLDGRYRPPYGPLGDLVDKLVMRFLARATARHFVTEAAAGLARAADTPVAVTLPPRDLVL